MGNRGITAGSLKMASARGVGCFGDWQRLMMAEGAALNLQNRGAGGVSPKFALLILANG